jgi:phage/plasmid primase-like uncharacterized protein
MNGDVISDFVAAMRERGFEPADEIIADGELHRVRWRRDKPGSRNGAYVLHLNGNPAGFVECFKRGIRFNWSTKGARLSPPERKGLAAKMAEGRKRREREERERHGLLAKQARAILEACEDADSEHTYLKRKGVAPHGLKVDAAGRLVIALRDAKGTIWSTQTIAPDGAKLFLKRGRKGGLFHLLGEPGDRIVIAEGFATAASIREATGLPVVIAFDCGNLRPVAKAIRSWLPLARIAIAADDDRSTEGNPGLSKARDAAELIGAAVAVPAFIEPESRHTDFNDLAALRGPEPAAEIIRAAFEELDAADSNDWQPAPDPQLAPDPQAGAASSGPSPDWEKPLLDAVDELNEKHFVVTVSGQTVIATLAYDDAQKRELLVFSQERDIKLRYRHRHYIVGHTEKGAEIWKSLGEAWLAHRNRRNYEKIALIPKGATPPDTFNLWRGFGVSPKPGKWPLIRQHLLEVICSGNESDCRWLIGWLARAVQYPELHAEVAVVLRGQKGTGKGTLGRILQRLFRQHAMQISNPAHFMGRFNGHLVDVLFLFVDEAFWAGDKAGEGTLKALVTEPTILVEPKFINPLQVTNRLKILIASNADWVVPATADERRLFMLDVSDCRRGDRDYFTELHNAIEGAELPALLDYLLSLDLSDFDFRNPPHTMALDAQKLVGADSLTRFWLDCLTTGEIVGTGEGNWPEDIVAQVLHEGYVGHAHDHGDRHPLTAHHMAEKLAKLMPGNILRRIRPHKPYGNNPRPTRYALDGLDACRAGFLEAMRINAYTWPED